MKKIIPVLVLAALAVLLSSQPAPKEQVGPLPGGGFLLNSGWKLRPAGRQVPLSTFPMSMVPSPDRRHVVVLNGGYRPPSLSVLDAATGAEKTQVPLGQGKDGWLGLTFTPDGKTLYVGGGSNAAVHRFSWSPEGTLTAQPSFENVIAGDKKATEDFVGDVAVSPDGRLVYATLLHRDMVAVINPQSGIVIERFRTGRRPYRILFHPDGKSLFVSSWADGSVYHHAAETGERLGVVRLGPHATDMLYSDRKPERGEEGEGEGPAYAGRLFVTASNTNNVFVVGVSPSKALSVVERINLAMTPRQPVGMTPTALGIDAGQERLYVACSDANAVAVVDIEEARSRVQGYVPTGWYPTAVRPLPDGKLLVLNGKGQGSFPNPRGPNPTQRRAPVHLGPEAVQYVGSIQAGSASVIDAFDEAQLSAHSATVLGNSPYRDALLDEVPAGDGNPVPSKPGDRSPIEHVVYVVKENRTYDQVLGDMKEGNGDPSLVLFGEEVSPNHHKLAREFVLFDNFYVNADVSADGHNWSTSAIANDYVQKMWPNSYAARRRKYDYEGGEPAALPPAGYVWTNASAAGLSMRNYGWWAQNRPQPNAQGEHIELVRDPLLAPVTNRRFRAFDLDHPDVARVQVFLQDLAEFEKAGQMPRLLFVRIGNDHTSGTAAGKVSPKSAVADNDYALGLLVEGLSRSRFWPKTAVFVLEDDAQNGPDHVDSHRAPAYVLSPYTRRGVVDSSMYNTTSMLRTMELILGMRPMTVFDAGARPMSAAFAAKPDLAPYVAEKPRIPLDDRNPAASPTASRSARLDLAEADRIDDEEMNDILWQALRGTDPPAPVRSRFSR